MSWWKKLPWWKKVIFPFACVAVMVLMFVFCFLSWVGSKVNRVPLYWEIVGVQKGKMFVRDLDENKLLEGGK